MFLLNDRTLKLHCLQHGCDHQITEAELETLHGNNSDFLKTKRRITEKRLEELDLSLRYCPRCSSKIFLKDIRVAKFECDSCNLKICNQCKEPDHGRLTCEQNLAKRFEDIGIVYCPVCKTMIQRNFGCNHMTCTICEYEFCWVCKKYAGEEVDHYNPDNLLSCGISKMEKEQRTWYERYGKRLLTFTFYLFLWPLILFLYCPVKWALKAYN